MELGAAAAITTSGRELVGFESLTSDLVDSILPILSLSRIPNHLLRSATRRVGLFCLC